MTSTALTLDRNAQIGDLADRVRELISRSLLLLAVVLGGESAYLWFTRHPGSMSFLLTSAGCLLILKVWSRSGVGLPIVPLLALENLITYGLPIVTSNESVMRYPAPFFTDAGIELLVFSCAMTAGWRFGMQAFPVSSPLCYAIQGFGDRDPTKLFRFGFRLATFATAYEVLTAAGLLGPILQMLPSGSMSIIYAVMSGVSACGFFLSAMILGQGEMNVTQRALFWTMFLLNCIVGASSLLLSSTITLVFAVLIGLFWSSGRIPWRFVLTTLGIVAFLNLGKFEMRERHWRTDEYTSIDQPSFEAMPQYYAEWAVASYDALVGTEKQSNQSLRSSFGSRQTERKSGQSLFDRLNNLQNLLYVIDAVNVDHIAPVGGATYSLIPPLLVPRILWPDKPRTHEGQVLLNVHFGRQDLSSTFRTYVAWGLQAEAYGNFGPILGAAILGAAMGLIFSWAEKYSARKLLLSMEGFLGFILFLGMANSFEMVASVLVTSLFQAFIPIILACTPFVERVVPQPRDS